MKIKLEEDDGREIAIGTATVVETRPGDHVVVSFDSVDADASEYETISKVVSRFFAPVPVLIFCGKVEITVTREAL
jgi:hypothetical protein